MKSELLSLLSFAIGIAAYTVSQLQQHGKLRWSRDWNKFGFWGEDSDRRKYTSKIPFAKTWLVFLTDGYHACQFIAGLFISLSFVPILGWTYGIAFWILAHITHWILYRTLQR